MQERIGSLTELRTSGRLHGKLGTHPVVVFWHEDRAWAIEDRCPHMGFPLHDGTVEAGLVTCHWHHARFDLASGCTLDPFADDARPFDVEVVDDDVMVQARPGGDVVEHARRRLRDGLEDGLTLVTAKSVLALLEAGVPASDIVRDGLEFGTRYRAAGWGAGLTVLIAMANLLPSLDPDDRALALVHGLAFVSRDTRNQPPRFALDPLVGGEHDELRLGSWYRRFVDTRSGDAAERVLATALVAGEGLAPVERMMFAAVTDHVFVDGGHTLDFTNKAFEALEHTGDPAAPAVLPTLVRQTVGASRAEESGEWRHPHDLTAIVQAANERIPEAWQAGSGRVGAFDDITGLAWRILDGEPDDIVEAILGALREGSSPAQLGQSLAYAAALRITRFHTQNDFGDWDTVHHAFTFANALHHALERNPTPELVRGVMHGALRVYLDRFLNVPAARLPTADAGSLHELDECWEIQDAVDRAGGIAYGYLRGGGDPARLVGTLAHAMLREDAEFHWFQILEAAVRQHHVWPEGSDEGALILAGFARFLAAHTPTRRERSRVVDIAVRLRRGEELYVES
jgi:nitrite reductase/ring-hydroxylating ferredoxin subunit